MFSRIAALFASREEQAVRKDERLMQEFAEQTLGAGQDEIDTAIESYIDALGTVNTYEEAKKVLQGVYHGRSMSPFARLRYAASGIGNHRKRRSKHG
jgi:hypothetical protein